ncbi:DUF637 domain-containing protein [Pseudomonas sp. SAICEU22]|uniref:DUF637 domain-containing protein n=1 Tax=Pseudomonas agronomica TaxID=2979328 RepID=A0ABT3FC49_9PSED|nr:DUF637 domain-containing protein [Pseudomonas agronomica]MCW1246065.1 DUF637 domain-containing protein [Pseudomonas agronomica]
MFKYLMNNAIASKEQLNLAVGVTLTSQQVAALTHDIVWMEDQVVNGEHVLVPVLYMAQANNRLAADGALIQGKNLTLIAGTDLRNAGTLRASENLSAAAGNNLVNTRLAEAGERLKLVAGKDLVNMQGGILKGKDVELSSLTGDIRNERTVSVIENSGKGFSSKTSVVDNAARIEAGNNLTVRAGRDLLNVGGAITAGNDADLSAGRDVVISAAREENGSMRQDKRHFWEQSQTVQHASEVKTGGDLNVTAGNNLTVVASHLQAKGDINLSGNDVALIAAANEDSSEYRYKRSGKKINKEEDHVQQQATTLEAGGDVRVSARNDLLMVASKIAAGNEAYLVAGNQLSLLAEQNRDYSLYDMKKKGGWGSLKMRRDEVTQITHVGSQIRSGGDLILKSGDDQRYQVAQLQSGKDLILESGGAIVFEGVKDLHDESHTKTNNNAFWNSAKGKGNTDETLRQTQMTAAGNITIKAVEGLKIDIKHVDQQTVSQTIDAMVKADPQLAWIKEAERRGDVDWRQVKEIHESFKYNTSGLGPASQLIIAIALAAVMGPMMATMNTMVQAGAISVATKATVSTIDNRGNLGAIAKDVTSRDSLKGYAVSIATAGVTQGLGYDASTVGFNAESVKTVAMKVAADATIKTAVYGGSFQDNLATSLAGTAASIGGAYGAGKIGDLGLAGGSLEAIVLHSALGGLMAEVMGGDFRTGAIAGGANEVLIGLLGDTLLPSHLEPGTPEYTRAQENLVALSKVVGVLGAAASNGDLDVAAQVAGNATQYNFLSHRDVQELTDKAKNCESEGTCDDLQAEASRRDAANHQRLMDCQRAGNCPEVRAEIDAGSKAVDSLVAILPEGKSADILGRFTGIGGGNTRDWTTAGQLHIEQVAQMFVGGNAEWAPSFGQWLDQSGFNPFSFNAPGLSATVVPGGAKSIEPGYVDVFPGNPGRIYNDIPATSAIAREGLRNTLAELSGVPVNMVEKPSSVWGASIDDMKRFFTLEGATLSPSVKAKTSGNAQAYNVEGSATGIVKIQYSPSTVGKATKSGHVGEYYKLSYKDGSKVKVIDPVEYKPSFKQTGEPQYDKNTEYLNPQGVKVIFDSSRNLWVPK